VQVIQQAIETINGGESLSSDRMSQVINSLIETDVPEKDIRALLTALHRKGEAASELVGTAKALRARMTRIKTSRENVVDTCGTGGSGKNIFNVSTAAALVAAAAGASVAKHGNRKSTSKSGSADVLEELGVNVNCPMPIVEKCLNQLGVCFCYAPLFHPSVAKVTPIRKKLEFPTIFNLAGPLCNPAGAPFQLLGAGRGETISPLAEALCELGLRRAMVVHGSDGLGEITIAGPTSVTELRNGHLTRREIVPEDFGIRREPTDLIQVQNPQQSADIIQRVLAGQPGPARHIVLMNAATALWITGICDDLRSGVERCEMAIDKGHARDILSELIKATNAK
jgi:anthranilate phosphoribosyltransferase